MSRDDPGRVKRRRAKAGDIFAIPLQEKMIAVGIALHISRRYRNGMLAGYFSQCFTSLEAIDIEKLPTEFAFTPNYTSKVMVELNEWPLIGHSDALLEVLPVPTLVTVTTLLYKDDVIAQLGSIEETRGYEILEGQGMGFVEDRLREYFEARECH